MSLGTSKLTRLFRHWTALLAAFFKKRDNVLLLIAVLAAMAVMLSVTVAFLLKPADYGEETVLPGQEEPIGAARHPLTGTLLEQSLEKLPQVFGVMIENSADAWPLSGIEQAFLVIEAPVEGKIPRFIAFFSEDQVVDKIGPVRSARPYYIDWNSDLDALYTHVGGSQQALQQIASGDTLDLNEFSQGEYFWRDNRRFAPHNVYTSTDRLSQALEELAPTAPAYQPWKFKADEPLAVDQLSVVIDWTQGDTYDVEWSYQPATNTYQRSQHEAVIANNIIIMATAMTVSDGEGRRQIRTTGEGDVLIVQDGRIILGKWKKPSLNERLRFYDESGAEVGLNAGTTWIEVVESISQAETRTELSNSSTDDAR